MQTCEHWGTRTLKHLNMKLNALDVKFKSYYISYTPNIKTNSEFSKLVFIKL